MVLWKTDVAGAFTLVWMRPEDCHLLGCEMMAGLVLLMFAGMFGLTIMPYVFEVVTRVISVLMARVVKGLPPLCTWTMQSGQVAAGRTNTWRRSGSRSNC